MKKALPKWEVWKHIPKLNAIEAIALTVNVEPSRVSKQASGKWVASTEAGANVSLADFNDRLFLFTRRFGQRIEMSLAELANWSQSVDWNIPLELAKLAPWPPVVYQATPPESIRAAIALIAVSEEDIAELQREIETEGWRFASVDGNAMVHIPDGTVKGRLEPLAKIYSLVCDLYSSSKNERIGNLLRGSGASGGGAQYTNFAPTEQAVCDLAPGLKVIEAPRVLDTSRPRVNEMPFVSDASEIQTKLWALADKIANAIRTAGDSVSLNKVCDAICTDSNLKANRDLLLGQKGWHTQSWLKSNGRLAGWKDPQIRK
jgi:hypothetical protein